MVLHCLPEVKLQCVATTLGTSRDEQMIDPVEVSILIALSYIITSSFSTGETGRVGTPKRKLVAEDLQREPYAGSNFKDDFAYTIRIVSEITESNGSVRRHLFAAVVYLC